MKRVVLYCLSCVLALTACIKENRDDCPEVIIPPVIPPGVPAELRLYFTHEHSVAEFDSEIANDVQLHIYQDYEVNQTEDIPYEAISGGREIVIDEFEPGAYTVVAWALPGSGLAFPAIPAAVAGSDYNEQILSLPLREDGYYEPVGDIFLGEETVTLSEGENGLYEISMSSCIAKVYFTLHNAGIISEALENEAPIWVELEGIHSGMGLDRQIRGEEATVYRDLEYNEGAATCTSGMMGVTHSAENQYLKATVYLDGEKLCMVETLRQASSGDEIIIDAYIGGQGFVHVNGWRVRTARFTFF